MINTEATKFFKISTTDSEKDSRSSFQSSNQKEEIYQPDFKEEDLNKKLSFEYGLVDKDQNVLDIDLSIIKLDKDSWERILNCIDQQHEIVVEGKNIQTTLELDGNKIDVNLQLDSFTTKYSLKDFAVRLFLGEGKDYLSSIDIVGSKVWELLGKICLEWLKSIYKGKVNLINKSFIEFLNETAPDTDIQIRSENKTEWQSCTIFRICMDELSRASTNIDTHKALMYLQSTGKGEYKNLTIQQKDYINERFVQELALQNCVRYGISKFNKFSLFSLKDSKNEILDVVIVEKFEKAILRHPLKISISVLKDKSLVLSIDSCNKELVNVPQSLHNENMKILLFPDKKKLDETDLFNAIKYGGSYEMIQPNAEKMIFENVWEKITDFSSKFLDFWSKHSRPHQSIIQFLFRACRFLYVYPKYDNAKIKDLCSSVEDPDFKSDFDKILFQTLTKEDFSIVFTWLQVLLFLFSPTSLSKSMNRPFYRYEDLLIDFNPTQALLDATDKIIPLLKSSKNLLNLAFHVIVNEDFAPSYPSPWLKFEKHLNLDNVKIKEAAYSWMESSDSLVKYLGSFVLLALPTDKLDKKDIIMLLKLLFHADSLNSKYKQIIIPRYIQHLKVCMENHGFKIDLLLNNEDGLKSIDLNALSKSIPEGFEDVLWDYYSKKNKGPSQLGKKLVESAISQGNLSQALNLISKIKWESQHLYDCINLLSNQKQIFLFEKQLKQWITPFFDGSFQCENKWIKNLVKIVSQFKDDDESFFNDFITGFKETLFSFSEDYSLQNSPLISRVLLYKLEQGLKSKPEEYVQFIRKEKFSNFYASFSNGVLAHKAVFNLMNALLPLAKEDSTIFENLIGICNEMRQKKWTNGKEIEKDLLLHWLSRPENLIGDINKKNRDRLYQFVSSMPIKASFKRELENLDINAEWWNDLISFFSLWLGEEQIPNNAITHLDNIVYYYLKNGTDSEEINSKHIGFCKNFINAISKSIPKADKQIEYQILFLNWNPTKINITEKYNEYKKVFEKLLKFKNHTSVNHALNLFHTYSSSIGKQGFSQSYRDLIAPCGDFIYNRFSHESFKSIPLLSKLYHIVKNDCHDSDLFKEHALRTVKVLEETVKVTYGPLIFSYEKEYFTLVDTLAMKCVKNQLSGRDYLYLLAEMVEPLCNITVKHNDFNVTNSFIDLLNIHKEINVKVEYQFLKAALMMKWLTMIPQDYFFTVAPFLVKKMKSEKIIHEDNKVMQEVYALFDLSLQQGRSVLENHLLDLSRSCKIFCKVSDNKISTGTSN